MQVLNIHSQSNLLWKLHTQILLVEHRKEVFCSLKTEENQMSLFSPQTRLHKLLIHCLYKNISVNWWIAQMLQEVSTLCIPLN